ncbi:MAG: Stp1/IreP family PP2C-type Ser/Thr phosphatase [Eubacteriales bacterium]|nr:Stp1/IreP family PP2C-type Ser/Thr phosphatase [Eubacteriales bacterium]
MDERKRIHIDFVSGTDRGLVRMNNEDACLVAQLEKKGYCIVVLADGMGGHRKGDIASRLAVNSVIERLYQELEADDPEEGIRRKIVEATERANVKVYLESVADESMSGMGTTLLVAVVHDGVIQIGNIGDSRAYFLRDEKEFYQVTRDHSYVQYLIDHGDLSERDAEQHPARHMLVRALGMPDYVNTDLFRWELKLGDRWLFCSDGLHGYVPAIEIASILREAKSASSAVQDLIDAANRVGGRDNITVIVGFVEERDPREIQDPNLESQTQGFS